MFDQRPLTLLIRCVGVGFHRALVSVAIQLVPCFELSTISFEDFLGVLEFSAVIFLVARTDFVEDAVFFPQSPVVHPSVVVFALVDGSAEVLEFLFIEVVGNASVTPDLIFRFPNRFRTQIGSSLRVVVLKAGKDPELFGEAFFFSRVSVFFDSDGVLCFACDPSM